VLPSHTGTVPRERGRRASPTIPRHAFFGAGGNQSARGALGWRPQAATAIAYPREMTGEASGDHRRARKCGGVANGAAGQEPAVPVIGLVTLAAADVFADLDVAITATRRRTKSAIQCRQAIELALQPVLLDGHVPNFGLCAHRKPDALGPQSEVW